MGVYDSPSCNNYSSASDNLLFEILKIVEVGVSSSHKNSLFYIFVGNSFLAD